MAAILFDISGKYNLDWDLVFVLNVYAYEKQERNCLQEDVKKYNHLLIWTGNNDSLKWKSYKDENQQAHVWMSLMCEKCLIYEVWKYLTRKAYYLT